MAYMQSVCSSVNKMKVELYHKVEFTKMKIKPFMFFFNDSLNKRVVTSTLELNESYVSTLLSSNISFLLSKTTF